jgi:hypothetical protein
MAVMAGMAGAEGMVSGIFPGFVSCSDLELS